jgi:UDP-N-acetylmuramoyl-tripeptide--D-alanyl-D-alanine ligase
MLLLALLALLVALVAGWRAWRRLRHFLHVFQLEGYKPNEYRAWLSARTRSLVLTPSHGVGLGLVALAAAVGTGWAAGLALFGWLIAFASDRRYVSAREKKPLAWTDRTKRLTRAALLLAALPVLVGTVAGIALGGAAGTAAYLLGWLLADLGAPAWVLAAAGLMKPVERSEQEGFKRDARAKLTRQTDLTIVGITGSYGKTSTKFAVAEVLRQRFQTLATPSSYNTPMGLCLVVNNQLRPDHHVLVLEYGIRYGGDMDELTDLARPQIAVLTSIGVAHLESMGSVENIAREKAKLLHALPPDGQAVVNLDDERVAAEADKLPAGIRVWRVSARGNPAADLAASDIRYGPEGATFTVRDDTGETYAFRTQLLGEHNVLNAVLALAVGRAMGLRLRQMVPAVERVRPVEHRLELKKEGPVTVIDDAFNANPVGAKNAVEVLGQFDARRRAIVTPGMVELGERQHEENKLLGRHIAEHLTREGDLAVLVGPRQTAPIQEGLREAGFPEERLRVVRTLFEARDLLKVELGEGDVVLYENDLPDQYDE